MVPAGRIVVSVATTLALFAASSEALVSSAAHLSSAPKATFAGNFITPARSVSATREAPVLRRIRGGAAAAQAGLTSDFVLKTIAPSCGVIIANLMFLAPMKQVLKANEEKSLGNTNVLPYPAQMGNCGAWLTYGLSIGNPYVILCNTTGLLFGLFYTLTGLRIGDSAVKAALKKSLAVYSAIVGGAIAVGVSGAAKSVMSAPNLFGWVGNLLLMVYYVSPLSNIAGIIRTKDAGSIDPRLAFAGVLNGLFWFVYGVAIWDGYVAIPNGIGALIATFTSACWLAFRK